MKKEHKLLILSNGSTIRDEAMQAILSKIDIVKLSLDCATKKCFKKLDRPHASVNLEAIKEGMKAFRKRYHGELVIEILVVEGINDTLVEFEALNLILQDIKPDRIDVGTIDRPPAYAINGVSMERVIELSLQLVGLHVNIAYKKEYTRKKRTFSEDEIVELLKRRPQSFEDVRLCFDETSQQYLQTLIDKKRLHVKHIAGVSFYTI